MKFLFTIYTIILCCLLLSQSSEITAQCAACQQAVDLVTNGNFDNGNSGFTTDLNPGTGFFCPLCPENSYAVGINATFYHNDFTGSDHTNPPLGDFLIANGPGQAGALVWCQSFPVQPGVDYTFTFWARDVTNNSNVHPYALLQPSFNGILINDTLVADGGWEMFTVTWNSGMATTLELCILNQQSQTGGNDFGIDDISLTACENITLSQSANAGPDQSICSNLPLAIGQQSLNGYTYMWDNNTGLNSSNISNPTLSVINTGPDILTEWYTLTSDSAGVGCITMDTVMIQILPMPTFTLGADLEICPGETTVLDAGAGWNSIEWSTIESTQSIEVAQGNFSVTVQNEFCEATDDILVSYTIMPFFDLGNDTTICSNAAYTLAPGQFGTWQDGSFSDSYTVTETTDVTFLYTNGNCTSEDDITVTVFEMPSVSLVSDTAFCADESLTIQASQSGLWNTGAIGNTITVNVGGYYDIVVQNGPCQTSVGKQITMLPLPVVVLPEDLFICEDAIIPLEAYNDVNTSYLWSTGDTTATINVQGAGTYAVEVENQCGTRSEEITIETYPCSWGLFVPAAFTPNDDLINDAWFVQGYNVSNVKVYVYNRFGDVIFKANDLGIPWYPSTGIGDDAYNYMVEATAFDGSPVVQRGTIHLLR